MASVVDFARSIIQHGPDNGTQAEQSARPTAAYPEARPQAGAIPFSGRVRGGAGVLQAQDQGSVEEAPLEGLPTRVKIPSTGEYVEAGPDPRVRQIARQYMEEAGLPYNPPTKYARVDPERSKRIADAYEAMPHEPDHPLVQAAYRQMAKEVMDQYAAAKRAGFKAEFWDPETEEDPYKASPRLAIEDIRKNHHMYVFPTFSGYGQEAITEDDLRQNPLLADSGERWNGKPVTINDIFRAIHDYYGHAKEGVGFRADGEENAWRAHASMFSPLARLAMTAETRGQNSWVNYGPQGDKNRTASGEDTVFADQKIGLIPHWVLHEGAEDFIDPAEMEQLRSLYERHGKAEGGEVDNPAPEINNPVSVFPKPQRMFGEDEFVPGGKYLNAATKEDMTGHKTAAASIGVQPGGRPYFKASADAVDETGTPGRGSAIAKTNLFKQKAGWKWLNAPEGHEETGTIVSVEHRGDHHYALHAHFPKGVDLARYENSPSEPRLRPTTRGNVLFGPQVGSISVRGKEHPVYDHVIVKANGGAVGNAEEGITAYHGSPHDFDEFDLSKIGTGEGAQAYGHGLYFAENEDIAKGYRNKLGFGSGLSPEDTAKRLLLASNEDREAALETARQAHERAMQSGDQAAIEHARSVRNIINTQPEKALGRMYEVRINAHPDHFLDWDKPLSEQSEYVQGQLKGYLRNLGGKKGSDFYSQAGLNQSETSRLLLSKGIKGIKYLDAGSRGAGEGSRNYVVFDDKLVNVKRKYADGGVVKED